MNICIVGLGLIGGTYAKCLTAAGHNVYGIDTDEETNKFATQNKIVINADSKADEILPIADVVIISIYPSGIIKFCLDNMNIFKENAIITDAGGIKTHLINEITPHLRKDLDFVFAHPMAGRETTGIHGSKIEIFENANFLITPLESNKKESIKTIKKLAIDMGFLNVTEIEAHEHDSIIAYTSQVCHIIALALVGADNGKYNTGKFTGGSYRDLTRIAIMNENLWSELFFGNRDCLLERIDDFIEEMNLFRNFISDENIDDMKVRIREITAIRSDIEKQRYEKVL